MPLYQEEPYKKKQDQEPIMAIMWIARPHQQ